MTYKIPLLQDLQDFGPLIKKKYLAAKAKKREKPENQRLELMDFYTKLVLHSKDEHHELSQLVLLGALIYMLEHIKHAEYKGYSPEKKNSWYGFFTGKGSDLYTLLKCLLDISKENKLPDDIRLRCLNKFYQYVKSNFPEQRQLLENTHTCLAHINKRELNRILQGTTGEPALQLLEKRLAQLPDNYKAKARIKHRDPERDLQLEFIKFINQSCLNEYDKNVDEFTHNFAYLQSCNVQYGLILFIILLIDSKHKMLSPEGSLGGWINKGSSLYKDCLEILDAKHLNKVECERKIVSLRALSDHLKLLKDNNDIPEKFSKYIKMIQSYISQQEIEKHTPKWYMVFCQFLVRYGLGFAATKLSADMVLKWIGGTIISGVSGPIGFVVYLTGGTILVSQLGKLVTEKIIPRATAEAYLWTLNRVGASITTAARDNVIYRFGVNRKGGLRALLNDPKITDEDREAVQNWFETRLELPDDIVSAVEKDTLRYELEFVEKPEKKVALHPEFASSLSI